ncbi:hypothetical protein [Leeuwenhoekiella marinoflava]|uniref:Uncharacterized protein n=2 Tax=Leeuwenhoekiella marinoflava TaxID=988 RepID=A0A4V1KSK1_9FLAO|nr:hypothetical protein [Leeuwenhoekiella marinoflava]RXG32018.1 hypothetical protein DSL99_1323 [Leeuwenhoekiella marinoflava]SHE95172.1 hypothetical protein SAMN02745246_01379 [Leeuwenhoekiella marinoflava DSM 3653]
MGKSKEILTGDLMRTLISACKSVLPEGWGITILTYQHNKPGIANYISDSERADMIKMLRETADRLENKQDFPSVEQN